MSRRVGIVAGTLIVASLAVARETAAEAPPPAPPSRPVVVDKVVAVVGARALLLSELRARAAPSLASLDKAELTPERRLKAERDVVNEVLQRLIDNELVAQAADRARIGVTAEEIDRAVGLVAAQHKVSVPALLNEVASHGVTTAFYREELGRQIREAKMLRLRPLPKGVKLADVDERKQTALLEQVRKEWLAELRRATYVEIRFGP